MPETPSWIFYIFFALVFIIFFIWNKHNKNHLTVEEKKLASSLLSEAWQRETKYIWTIFAAILTVLGFLFVLEKVFAVDNATEFIFIFILFTLTRTIFRNRGIYQKANLPQKFIKGDFALEVFVVSAFAIMIVFIFLD